MPPLLLLMRDGDVAVAILSCIVLVVVFVVEEREGLVVGLNVSEVCRSCPY